MSSSATAADLIHRLRWPQVPERVRWRVGALLTDFVAVAVAGRLVPAAWSAADHATAQHAGDEATLVVDGRRAAATGAAWANGVLANALDFDDGHRLVKGHPGAVVIPSALAVAEVVDAPPEELLAAVLAGYEVAVRAGIHLHRLRSQYHGSGTWGALGAAAAAARLLRLDPEATRHALGVAAYHAPVAPIMRSVADPAMTKDACGWGAMTGTSAALLAANGFTATASDLLDAIDRPPSGLGEHWRVEELYVKPFPCCRWSHPAVAAALALRERHELRPDQVARVTVRTFAAATALARRRPRTTEEAQYSLLWPVAAALAHGGFDVEHVLPPAFEDMPAVRLAERIGLEVDPGCEAAFPAARRAEVIVETTGGARHRSGMTDAPGEPEDPGWAGIVASKLHRFGAKRPPLLDDLLKVAGADLPVPTLPPR